MDAILSLYDSSLPDEYLTELTKSLRQDLSQNLELSVQQPEEAGASESKGISEIIMLVLGSGGAGVALLQVLKSYVERRPSIRIELERADGRKLKIDAEHLSPAQIEQTLQAVQQLCKD